MRTRPPFSQEFNNLFEFSKFNVNFNLIRLEFKQTEINSFKLITLGCMRLLQVLKVRLSETTTLMVLESRAQHKQYLAGCRFILIVFQNH